MKTILLFTEYFPFGNRSEHAFLQNEIKYLIAKFDKIIVIPSNIISAQTYYKNLEVNNELSIALKRKNKWLYPLLALKNKFFYKELFSKKISFWDIKKIKRLVYFVYRSQITKEWVIKYLKNSGMKDNEILVYTFWNNEITLALSSLKNIKVVSRVHGHDLYEEYDVYCGYLPCYKYTLQNIYKLYTVSQQAFNYIKNKYPLLAHKFEKRHLGVMKSDSLSVASKDDVFRIVSCCRVIKRKRVDLIVKGIRYLINKYQKHVYWVHFGDGDELGAITRLVSICDKQFFKYSLLGFVQNSEILKYYKTNPIDIFILTSELEGGVPVVLQEAQAHGIPVIGTKIGGIPEIVNEKVGVLLSENPTEEEIADAIYYILSDRERFKQMRMNSVKNWEENFNEQKNYEKFSSELINLLNN